MDQKAKSLWDQWEYEKFFEYHYFDGEGISPWPKDQMWEKLKEGDMPYSFQRSRGYVLKNIGAKPTFRSENMIVDGCSNAFSNPQSLGNYFQLLNELGIKYNLLPKRYCCGFFILTRATPDEWDDAVSKVKSLAEKNIREAKELGAKNIYEYCHLCSVMAQYADLKGTGMTVGYGLDILIEPLKKVKKLKVKPTRVGYYRGCWARKKALKPDFKLNFEIWRSWLDRIEGLEVMDFPNNICCFNDPQSIVKMLKDNNLDYIVTPCVNCRLNLNNQGAKTVMLGDLLHEALNYKD
jgi:Fe-S oxidoreductase